LIRTAASTIHAESVMFARDTLTTTSQTQVRAAGELHRRHRHPAQGVCLLQPPRAHGHRREPGRRGVEERRPGPGNRLQHDQLPDPRGIREQQRRGRRLDGHPRKVGADHHAAPRQTISQDAADEQENDQRGNLRRQHEAQVARGSRQVEHRPGQRKRRDSITEQRHQLSREEQAELTLLERAERNPPHLGPLPGLQ
jgi:hypothetical protein